MRRGLLVSLTLFVIVIVCVYGVMAYEQPLPALASHIIPSTYITPAITNLQWPANGQAAIGASGYGVLATHGGQTTSPTASLAKVMNALLVLKAKPMSLGESGPTLTLTQADVDSYNAYVTKGGSVVKVNLGEEITEYQALEALLLPSADNMADTLAIWAYGSIAAYSAAADSLASQLGMTQSYFGSVDASGYSPDTHSTAHDLVLLGQEALKNPVLAHIVAEPAATVPEAGTVHNVNWLLGSRGINGIKTGNTDQAGGVFLFSAQQAFTGGRSANIVGAIMEPSSTLLQAMNDSVPLLTSTEANFVLTPLVRVGTIMGSYAVPWAGTVSAVAGASLHAITWGGQTIVPKIVLKKIKAPIAAGTTVGAATFPDNIGSVPIIVKKPVASPTWLWRLRHELYVFFSIATYDQTKQSYLIFLSHSFVLLSSQFYNSPHIAARC